MNLRKAPGAPPTPAQVVVVSGAGSGIGFATSRHLAEIGYTVIAGVRSDEQATRLRDGASDRLQPFPFDVTSDPDVAAVVSHVAALRSRGCTLRGIFSNAGIEGRSPDLSAEGCPISTLTQVMDVNYFGAVRFIQGFLPMAREDRSTIVVNSALMARIVIPFNGGYAPSKAALESWAIALRREIAPHGVRVALIELGGIATSLTTQVAETPAPNPAYPQQAAVMAEFATMATKGADNPKMQPERAAELVASALAARNPRIRYLGGGGAHLLATVAQLPQRAQDRLVAAMLARGGR
ncbi:MAG: SDR family NAD(P)-dependent oxidoreductase [Candidatus Nanopelagicales bacterium]